MKIRIIGLPDEVVAAAEQLAQALDVIEVSRPYPCRGNSRQYRLYLDVRLRHEHQAAPAQTAKSNARAALPTTSK